MSGCDHQFEQLGYDRLPGSHATCECCQRVVLAPEYASCRKCGRTLCVGCIIVVPMGRRESDDGWEEVTESDITDRVVLGVIRCEDEEDS